MKALSTPPDGVFPGRNENHRPKTSTLSARRGHLKPRPKPIADIEKLYRVIGRPNQTWDYKLHRVPEFAWVMRYDLRDGTKKYRTVTHTEGGWRIEWPEIPFPLYRRDDFRDAETIFVCEGEKTAEVAIELELTATTSLGGPLHAAFADWSPLKDRHVVILRDFDDEGLVYAEDVAKHALAAGARSAKIVTLPDLGPGEDLCDWLRHRDPHNKRSYEWEAAILAEIAALVAAAPLVVQQASPPNRRVSLDDSNVSDERESTSGDLQRLSDVALEPLEWVWEGVIPIGKLTLIMGETGVAKSYLALDAIARATGTPRSETTQHDTTNCDCRIGVDSAVPLSTNVETTELTDVQRTAGSCENLAMLFTASDGLGDTIKPRMAAAGVDLSRVIAKSGVRRLSNGELFERECRSSRACTRKYRAWRIQSSRAFCVGTRIQRQLMRTNSSRLSRIASEELWPGTASANSHASRPG